MEKSKKKIETAESILEKVYEEISTNTGKISKATSLKIFKYFNK